MELTTICVFIVIWIFLCVVTNIIAFFLIGPTTMTVFSYL